jgi:hypothetical protein
VTLSVMRPKLVLAGAVVHVRMDMVGEGRVRDEAQMSESMS